MNRTQTQGWRIRYGVVAILWVACAHAATVNLGALSFETFIPAGNGSPGVDAFDLVNFTGVFSLPPDFPVADALTFGSAALTLTLSDLSQSVIFLGDIGPGFLLDQSGNPVVQVAGDQAFNSAEFTAVLLPQTFALSDGTSFTAASRSIDVILLPSSGPTLAADVDQAAISASGTAGTAVPEPSSLFLLALAGLAWTFGTERRPVRRSSE